ncbi:hypothetical protein EH150_06435 [Carnobacterium divergens]|nr:hypothetical protein [Carnobacterium divergens]
MRTLDGNLNEIRKRLGLNEEKFEKVKERVESLETDTRSQLSLLLESKTVPEEFEFIVRAVVVKRFNRFKNEGMKSINQSEETITYDSDDFGEYESIINKYVDDNKPDTDSRTVEFI